MMGEVPLMSIQTNVFTYFYFCIISIIGILNMIFQILDISYQLLKINKMQNSIQPNKQQQNNSQLTLDQRHQAEQCLFSTAKKENKSEATQLTSNKGLPSQKSKNKSLNQKQKRQYELNLLKKKLGKRKQRQEELIHKLFHKAKASQSIQTVRGKNDYPQNLIAYLLQQNQYKQYKFVGTCFFIQKNIAVASAHQTQKNSGKLLIRIPENIQKGYKDYLQFQVKNKFFSKNYNGFNSKYDYVLLKIIKPYTPKEKQGYQQIKKRTQKLLFSDYKDLQNFKFSFLDGINYGFIKSIPQQIVVRSKIEPLSLLFSKGNLYYYNGHILQYNAYTINGMSGGPIFIQIQNQKYLIGMHLYGSCLIQKNYGLIFTKQFYRDLDFFRQYPQNYGYGQIEDLQQEQTYLEPLIQKQRQQRIKRIYVNSYCSLSDKLTQIEQLDQTNQIKQLSSILNSLVDLLRRLQFVLVYVESVKDQDIIIDKSGQLQLRNAQLKYNPFSRQSIIKESNSVIFLQKFIKNNIFIQIQQSSQYKQKPSDLRQLIKLLNNQQFDSIESLNKSLKKQQNKQTYQSTNIQYQILQDFQIRAESFIYLIKYSSKKLTIKSFLRIYIGMISQIYQQIKRSNLSINPITDFQFYFKDQLMQLKQFKQIKDFYIQRFQQNQLLDKQYLIEDLAKYQIVFIHKIYKIHLLPKLKYKNIFIAQTKIKYNLYQPSDKIPQNGKKIDIYKYDYKKIKILQKIYNQNQTRQYVYQMTAMTEKQQQKYVNLTKNLVGIIQQQHGVKNLVGTGFIIAQNLICTCLHVFGKNLKDTNHLRNRLKKFTIRHNDIEYIIDTHFPSQIVPRSKRIHQKISYDILILSLKTPIKGFQNSTDKLAFMSFSQTDIKKKNQKSQRYLSLIAGFVEVEDNNQKKIIYKKSVGQISFDSSCQKYYIPLQGQNMISGSPIFMLKQPQKLNKNSQKNDIVKIEDVFIVGVYTAEIRYDEQLKRVGVYSRLDEQYFKQILHQINVQKVTDYQNFRNKKLFIEYIRQYYGAQDSFLLQVVAQILKLNHHHYYIKELSISNLILNQENNRSIFFNNLQLINISQISSQILQKQNQNIQNKRDLMRQIFKRCQKQNLQAFGKFISQIILIYQQQNIYQNLQSFYLSQTFTTLIQNSQNLTYIFAQQTQRERMQQQYCTIYQRHFFHKPKQRLQQLITFQTVLFSDKGSQYCKDLHKNTDRQRSLKIEETLNSKRQTLKNTYEHNNMTDKLLFYKFMYQIFQKGAKKFYDRMKDINVFFKKQENFKKFTERLENYTKGIISIEPKYIQKYRQSEIATFENDNDYSNIIKWTMIEEILEYFQCLNQITINEASIYQE